MCVFSYIDYS